MLMVFGKVTPSWFVGTPACLSTVQAPPNSQPVSSYYLTSSGSQTDRHSLVFKGAPRYTHRSLLFSSLSFKFHLPSSPEFWSLSDPKRWLLSVWSAVSCTTVRFPEIVGMVTVEFNSCVCLLSKTTGVFIVYCQIPEHYCFKMLSFFFWLYRTENIWHLYHFDLLLLHYDWKWKVYKAFLKIQLLSKSLIKITF